MVTQDEIKLVLARLDATPSRLKFAIAGMGSFTVTEMKNHVKNAETDPIGEAIVRIHMDYLQHQKEINQGHAHAPDFFSNPRH